MTLELTVRLTILFVSLFTVGSLLCLPLFQWRLRRLFDSSLWTKIIWWIPLYGIFLALCLGKVWVAIPQTVLIVLLAAREYHRQRTTQPTIPALVKVYLAFFMLATLAITGATTLFNTETTITLLITICLCSVLSDVCAFFMGTYMSWHKLPTWINPRKSWEGVLGQIIGAFIGAGLVIIATGLPINWWLVLTIGIASAIGDLFNSAAKRLLHIKDWGQTIPGHGGVLDRMSSLSTAFLAATILTLLL
jgi:CDP-diglyceride synthetase